MIILKSTRQLQGLLTWLILTNTLKVMDFTYLQYKTVFVAVAGFRLAIDNAAFKRRRVLVDA